MAILPEVDQFDAGVYQWETTDQALGGVNGVMNTPGKSFANRTRYLLNRLLDGFLNFVGDSGAKNVITLVFPQPVPALRDGMEINFRVAVTNDNAVNVALTNAGGAALPTLPLYGGDHAALSGGELPAGAEVRARLNAALNVANGGAWVIMAITGGYGRVPTAPVGDMSTKVANMAALFQAFNGLQTVDVSAASDTALKASQYGVGMLKLSGALQASKNLLFPAQTGQWIIENDTTGNYNITAAVTGGVGVGVVLPVGQPVIIQSDGTNIKFASAGGQAGFRAVPVSGVAGTSITITGGYTPGALLIEKNGAILEPGTAASPDFTATDGKTINFTTALVAADTLTIYLFSTFSVSNAVQKSGDTMGGPLALYAGSTVSAPAAGDNSQNVPSTGWFKAEAATETNVGTLKVATQALTNAGADDTTAVTPKKLRAGFSISLGVGGYAAFPTWLGGVIFQWGSFTTTTAGGGVTFPVTFPTATRSVLATSSNYSYPPQATLVSASGCTLALGTQASTTIYWLAFGY
ncbi:gp53-like domain-containing protein [Paraburkholderia sp. J12]|uniref:gp53-like domain-containing protein n=1 Tax=Paraburkholderia sp. J12 TaxID=2805432 RepID=UPI002ABE0798|nr:hypothetical protein [Paraburkholderia sp. J12]